MRTKGQWVIGVDEAGRGPLAGPVAVGVVLAPKGFNIKKAFPGVADSKKLSEKKREEIFALLQPNYGGPSSGLVRYVVMFASAKEIDKKGIVVAIRHAVARGLKQLLEKTTEVRPPYIKAGPLCLEVLLDGSLHAPAEYAQKTIIKGDVTEPIISLASIAAKVTRDRLMQRLAKKYPGYGFEQHKGYGTKGHYEALMRHGLSPEHRKTFLTKLLRNT